MMRLSTSIFLFCIEPIWLAHHSRKMKLFRLRKIEGSILKYRVCPLWPSYVDERRTTFAKAHRIKVRCYWELFGGTCQELGNSLLWPRLKPLFLSLALALHIMLWIYGIKSCHKPRTINLFLAPYALKQKESKGKEKKWPKSNQEKRAKREMFCGYLNS